MRKKLTLFGAIIILICLTLYLVIKKYETDIIASSSNTTSILIIDPKNFFIINEIKMSHPLNSPFKILRNGGEVYLITKDGIVILNSQGIENVLLPSSSKINDALIEGNKIYLLTLIGCNPKNITCLPKSKIEVYNIPSLSKLSEYSFNNTLFGSLQIIGDKIYLLSFPNSKLYTLEDGKIIGSFQFTNTLNSVFGLLPKFKDELFVFVYNGVYFFNTSSNSSTFLPTCNSLQYAKVYNNSLFVSCFQENKTIEIDLNTKTIKSSLELQQPFFISSFDNKLFITAPEKVYVIDPTNFTLITTLNFDVPIQVIG